MFQDSLKYKCFVINVVYAVEIWVTNIAKLKTVQKCDLNWILEFH